MEITFNDKHLDKLETDGGFEGGHSPDIIKAYRKRIQLIRNAPDERDFYSFRSLKFEKLKGDRQHQYSMRLNDQWRLILEFQQEGANKIVVVIGIEDYH